MKRVYATTDAVEAGVLCALLRDAGLEPVLGNEGGADFAIGMPTSAVPLGIDVADEDVQEAAEILSGHFGHRPPEGPADPEAPEPLSAEESAAFEEKVRRGNRRWGRRLITVYLLPVAFAFPVALAEDGWIGGVKVAAGIGSLLAVAWFVNLIFEPQRDPEKAEP